MILRRIRKGPKTLSAVAGYTTSPAAAGNNGTGSNAAAAQSFQARGPRRVSYRQIRRGRLTRQLGSVYSGAQDGGVLSGPALIGLITTLAPAVLGAIKPLLEKSPELLGTFIDSPLRLFNAVSEAERQEQQLTNQQIENMLQQGNQALLLTLLQNQARRGTNGSLTGPQASLSPAAAPVMARSQMVASRGAPRIDDGVQASFIVPQLTEVAGRPRALYLEHRDLTFRLVLETSHSAPSDPMPKAIARLRVKDFLDGRLLLEHRYQLRDLFFNQAIRLELSAEEVATLPRNTDLLVSADISWLDQSQQVHTTKSRATQSLFW